MLAVLVVPAPEALAVAAAPGPRVGLGLLLGAVGVLLFHFAQDPDRSVLQGLPPLHRLGFA